MSPLAGLGVLVTRPDPQAEPLARRLESLGARVYRLPAIEIRAREGGRAAMRAALGPVDRWDWLVFVSANAVRHGAFLLEAARLPRLAAVGPATASALELAGHRVALVPTAGFDTEALLASPEFRAVAGQRVLIVRGDGGRELLADTLRARGAEVAFAEVYERGCATPVSGAVAAVEEAWSRGGIDVVTATSAELLRCLIEILGIDGRLRLRTTPLLAGGARIAEAAAAMGHEGVRIVAAAADDASLVDALVGWWRDEHG